MRRDHHAQNAARCRPPTVSGVMAACPTSISPLDCKRMRLKSILLSLMLAFNLAGETIAGAAEKAHPPASRPAATNGFTVEKLSEGIYAAVRTDPPGLMV